MIPVRLQWYVLREVIRVAFLSVLALTGIIFIGLSVSLLRAGVSIVQIHDVIPYALAMSLPLAAPSGFLLAAVFVFGRLSGQNEITALRGSGVNLNSVILPPLLLALVVCCGAFFLNHYLQPWSMGRIRTMRKALIQSVMQRVGSRLEYEVGNYVIYAGGMDDATRQWKNVAVVRYAGEYPSQIMFAQRGYCTMADDDSTAVLHLDNVNVVQPRVGENIDTQPPAKLAQLIFRIPLDQGEVASLNKPKYLPLTTPEPTDSRKEKIPDLLDVLITLRKQARAVRAEPMYARVKHPQIQRQRQKRALDKAYRDHQRLSDKTAEHVKGIAALQAATEKAQREHAAAKAARNLAAERKAEAEQSIASQQLQLTQLRQELEQMRVDGIPSDRIAGKEQEIRQAATKIAQWQERARAADADLTQREAALATRVASLQGHVADQEKAREAADHHQALADKAYQQYSILQDQDDKLEILEDQLRAESDFHFRNAAATTTLVLTLLGIPLGILSRRGNVILAFVISFGVVLVIYYPLVMVMQMLARDDFLTPWVAQWLPNVLVGAGGWGLLTWGIRR